MQSADIDHNDLMHGKLVQRAFTRPGWSFEMKLVVSEHSRAGTATSSN